MSLLDDLLRAVLDDPADDGARLVYADALEEVGETERAEFVRVQLALANWPCDCDTDYERVYYDECRCKERAALRHRERKLLSIEQDRVRETLRSGTDDVWWTAWEFRRGFLYSISCKLADWYGGECGRCKTGMLAIWEDGGNPCKDCHGTGRTPGHGPAIVAQHPVEVVVTEKRPNHGRTINGPRHSREFFCWFRLDGEGHNVSTSTIPEPIHGLLPPSGREYRKDYATEIAANTALSAALIAWAKGVAP